MREDLKHPDLGAVKSVLTKIGVDPESRNLNCQDYEYTTCSLKEFPQYLELYSNAETSMVEKRVLGCYLLECLNEYVSKNEKEHPQQREAFALLYSDIEIHRSELAYFGKTAGLTEEERPPIAKYLLSWERDN